MTLVVYADFHTLLGHKLEPQVQVQKRYLMGRTVKIRAVQIPGARWPLETNFYMVTPNISGYANRKLPEVTLPAPIVLKWLPDF
jgi:hypothetical protein